MSNKRFKVALSFPGEYREFIEQVASLLAMQFGKPHVFYDNFHRAELARPNLDIRLMDNYKDDSELVVVFLCKEYDEKEWCGLEWRVVRDMIKHKRYNEIMPFRFDDTIIPGFLSIDGYIFIDAMSPQEVCSLILERLELNEKEKPKVTGDVSDVQKILDEIKELKQNHATPELQLQLQSKAVELESLRQKLSESEELIEQQKKITQELEKSIGSEIESNEKKKKALEAIEGKDYESADRLLHEAAAERIAQVAEDFYQIGKVKELKLEYRTALEKYELAVKISPNNVDYLDKAGRLSRDLGYADKAISYFDKAIIFTTDKKTLSILYNENGSAWNSKGEYDKGIGYYEQALVIGKEYYGESHPQIAICYNNLGSAWDSKGEYDKAIGYYERALAIDKEYYGESYPQIAIRYNNLGSAWDSKGEYDKAIEYYEQALVIDKEYYGESHPKIAIRYNNLGMAWGSKGEYDKAIGYYEQALAIGKEYYGESHPQIAIRYNNLGGAWNSKGEYDKAIGYYERALAIDKEYYGESHPQIAIRYNNLGSAWYWKGEYDKAIGYYEWALTIDKEYYGESHPDIATDYNNLGAAWCSKGEYDNAIGYYERALTIDKEYYGESHPKIAIRYNNLGGAWHSKGEYDKAIGYYEQAVAIDMHFLGEAHPSTKNVMANLEACIAAKNKIK